jgi:hypothetical protein
MAITITCPSCSIRLTLDDDRAGTTFECPKCYEALTLPTLSTLSLPPEASPTPAPEPEPQPPKSPSRKLRGRSRRSRDRGEGDRGKESSPTSSAAALILALLLGVFGGGVVGAGLGFAGGAVIARGQVRFEGGGESYDTEGRRINPAGTGIAGACCMTPVGSLIGATVGCMYIMMSSKKRK